MKLVYISDSIIPSRYANGVQVMKMCNAFAEEGYDVALFARDSNDKKIRNGSIFSFYGVLPCFRIEQLRCFPGKIGKVGYAVKAALKAILMSPDLVYGRSLLGCYICAAFGRAVILEMHCPLYENSRVRRFLIKRLIANQNLKRLVVISDALKHMYMNALKIDDNMITVAHDAADGDIYSEADDVCQSEGILKVGYFGHLYTGRGIEMMAKMARQCPWASFTLVGGTERDIRYWKEKCAGISNMEFVGYVEPSMIARYMRRVDVLLAPYQRSVAVGGGGNTAKWMSPLKIFEYMSAGKPIICSDLPVLVEVLTHEETALLCDPESPDQWVGALKRLRGSRILRRQFGDAARKSFLNEYTWALRVIKVIPNEYRAGSCYDGKGSRKLETPEV